MSKPQFWISGQFEVTIPGPLLSGVIVIVRDIFMGHIDMYKMCLYSIGPYTKNPLGIQYL